MEIHFSDLVLTGRAVMGAEQKGVGGVVMGAPWYLCGRESVVVDDWSEFGCVAANWREMSG